MRARAPVAEAVDSCVVEGPFRRRDLVVSSDREHLIADGGGRMLEVEAP